MNFYIGDSIEKLDINSANIELDDSLYQFIYASRNFFEDKIEFLLKIDPYSDVLIPISLVRKLELEFTCLLESEILKNYNNYDDAKDDVVDLILLCRKAICMNVGLISIGD